MMPSSIRSDDGIAMRGIMIVGTLNANVESEVNSDGVRQLFEPVRPVMPKLKPIDESMARHVDSKVANMFRAYRAYREKLAIDPFRVMEAEAQRLTSEAKLADKQRTKWDGLSRLIPSKTRKASLDPCLAELRADCFEAIAGARTAPQRRLIQFKYHLLAAAKILDCFRLVFVSRLMDECKSAAGRILGR